MVHRKAKPSPLILILLVVAVICASLAFAVLLFSINQSEPANEKISDSVPEEPAKTTDFIDLQPTISNWLANNSSGRAGIVIYDLDNQQIAAALNQNEKFGTASLYKLFVVYEGYLEVEQGTLSPNKILAGGHTVSECLDLAIRESNSTCAESLRATIGAAKIDHLVNEWGMTSTSVSGLSSTPNDIFKIMQKYYEHTDLSEESWAVIEDSMLNQPPVNNGLCDGPCNWRRGLPSGFSIATVYDKVGWEHSGVSDIWNLYHDAAIIKFPETDKSLARTYIVVVMTSKIPLSNIVELGALLEQTVLAN